VDNCKLPIQLLCDPTRANDALNWLEKFYEQEQEKKRKLGKGNEKSTKKKVEDKIHHGKDSFLGESKPKWVVIRKYGQMKGGVKIQLPKDIPTLLKVGSDELSMNAAKVRELSSEAEIKEIGAIKEDEIVYLTTQEDEMGFK
jgi:hypothetical protein